MVGRADLDAAVIAHRGVAASGSADRYFQDTGEPLKKMVPEGIEGMVPFKGGVHQMVDQLTGGLRQGLGLSGSGSVKELRCDAQLLRVTASGQKEGHAHDVLITKEAPNYWIDR